MDTPFPYTTRVRSGEIARETDTHRGQRQLADHLLKPAFRRPRQRNDHLIDLTGPNVLDKIGQSAPHGDTVDLRRRALAAALVIIADDRDDEAVMPAIGRAHV